MPPSVYLKMKEKKYTKVVSSRQLAGVAFVALFIFVRVFAQHLCSAHPNRCSGLCAVKLEKLKKKTAILVSTQNIKISPPRRSPKTTLLNNKNAFCSQCYWRRQRALHRFQRPPPHLLLSATPPFAFICLCGHFGHYRSRHSGSRRQCAALRPLLWR